jgi:hypothetical protein
VAAGAWKDRSPCRPPLPLGFGSLAHDAQGRLWSIDDTNLDGSMALWQWDPAVRHFWNQTPCTVDGTWPVLQDGVLGYDPMGDRLVITKYGAISGNPATWFGQLGGNGITWTNSADYVDIGNDVDTTAMVFDAGKQSMFLTAPPFYTLPPGGTVWSTSINVAQSLFPLDEGPAGYDPVRGTFVMVLPNDTGANTGPATWEFSLAAQSWSVRSTEAFPASGVGALWWNPETKVLGMVASDQTQLSVWNWDPVAGTWNAVTPAAGSSVPTGAFSVRAVSFDPVEKVVVAWLQSGGTDVALWAWDGTSKTWTRLSPDRWPLLWPQMIDSFQAVYDTVNQRDLFVGARSQQDLVLLDWDGVAPVFTDRHVAPGDLWPTNLSPVAAALDRHRGKLMICGAPNPNKFSELWEWDVVAGGWTNLTPATAPAGWPSCGAANTNMVYDAGRRRIVVGSAVSAYLTEMDPQTGAWQVQSPPTNIWQALSRCPNAVVYDEKRQRVVIASAVGTVAEWDGTTWTLPLNATPNGCPTSAPTLVGTYDARRGRVVLFMNDLTGGPQQLWTWDGAQLVNATPSPAGLPMRAGTVIDDLGRGNLMVFGWSVAPAYNFGRFLNVWEGALP